VIIVLSFLFFRVFQSDPIPMLQSSQIIHRAASLLLK